MESLNTCIGIRLAFSITINVIYFFFHSSIFFFCSHFNTHCPFIVHCIYIIFFRFRFVCSDFFFVFFLFRDDVLHIVYMLLSIDRSDANEVCTRYASSNHGPNVCIYNWSENLIDKDTAYCNIGNKRQEAIPSNLLSMKNYLFWMEWRKKKPGENLSGEDVWVSNPLCWL